MAGELTGKVAAVTGAASGIGLASAEAMLAAGARVVDGRPRRGGAEKTPRQARRRRDPAGHRPARPEGLRHARAESPREGGPARHPPRERRPLCRRRPRRRRQRGDRPDAEPQRQCGDEERARRAAAHDRAGSGDIIVTSSLAAHFPTPGSRSTPRPNGRSTASSRRCGGRCSSTDPRRLDLAGAGHHRALADWPAEKLRKPRSRAACSRPAKWPMW